MKLIIGLGNPGEKYKNNRHNVGHMVVEKLLKRASPQGVMVIKTNSFMNESGEFVKKLVEQYKLDTPNLWIIHDDLDIPLGSFKIQKGKGPKLHNGINSIERELGTDEFWRIRIGVDNRDRDNKTSGEAYVLEDFSDEERKILEVVLGKVCRKLEKS
jgi:PTH1 family peptidyl-tRNA hydrolase